MSPIKIIVSRERKKGFPLPNKVYEDPSLNWAAKGLMTYILGLPNGNEFSIATAAALSSVTEHYVGEILRLLIDTKYIRLTEEKEGDVVVASRLYILKGETLPPNEVSVDDPMFGFDKFWDTYPKGYKTGKSPCETKWASKRCAARLTEILQALDLHKKTRQWLEGYIPNPLTWLNQERWNDEIELPVTYGH